MEVSITAVHGLGYKLLSNTHLLFIVYFFANKLNVVLAASASRFTREEADAFLGLMMANLFRCSEIQLQLQASFVFRNNSVRPRIQQGRFISLNL